MPATLETPHIEVVTTQPEKAAMGGALEGAERHSRELATWNPSMRSPDQVINLVKTMADARGRDMVWNDGHAMGAVNTHKDSIVGAYYRLNATPNWRVLGADEKWAEEFQQVIEPRFNTLAESADMWLDASGHNTFTGMIRLGVGGFVFTGEVLATAEWLREARRPIKTAIQMVSPDRLSNPDGLSDDRWLRRGIRRNKYGRPLTYYIRRAHPTEYWDQSAYSWAEVPATKPWGRKQVIHILEQLLPDQSRGIAEMVSVLKQMRMTKKFQEVVLQNAVINASFAAAIESELPPDAVYAALGAAGSGNASWMDFIGQYLTGMNAYVQQAANVQLDGAKIPHLFPGTKLNMKPMGTPGGVGTEFEEALHRYTAAGLGVSYEEFTKDYSKTSYSSARTSMINTWRFMQSRKKSVADRLASDIYALVLEEEINAGNVPLPPGKNWSHFYEPLMKDAYCQASWIGASRGQIDELKETEAAIRRIQCGLSTYEDEIARLGKDWREVFAQRAREEGIIAEKNLKFSLGSPGSGDTDEDDADEDDAKPGEKKTTSKEDK